MPFLPAWAPNLHPLVVHFPIALLFGAAAVDLAGLLAPDRKPLRDTATWLYVGGAATAVFTYFTGYTAAQAATFSPEVGLLVDAHADRAFAATWLFAFFASLRLAMSYILRPRRALQIGAFAIALAGLGALAQTTLHGARLVFEQGLGVRAVASAEASAKQVERASAERAEEASAEPVEEAPAERLEREETE